MPKWIEVLLLSNKTNRGPDPRNAWIGKKAKHAEKQFRGTLLGLLFICLFVYCFQKALPLQSRLVIIIQFLSKSQLLYPKVFYRTEISLD